MPQPNGNKENQPVIIVKKVVDEGGHHGGAWKVAYADFVTAMMAFFLVMWVTSMDPSTKEGIEGYFKDPSGKADQFAGGQGVHGAPMSVGIRVNPLTAWKQAQRQRFEMVKTRLEEALKNTSGFEGLKEFVDIQITENGLVIELLDSEESFFFESGSAKLKPKARQLLGVIAKEMGDLPNPIVLEGHTDVRRFAGDRYTNWELSADRANAARAVMEETGLRRDQVAEVRGYADKKLRTPDDPTHYSNRRVSILAQFSETPPPDFVEVDQDGQVHSGEGSGAEAHPIEPDSHARH